MVFCTTRKTVGCRVARPGEGDAGRVGLLGLAGIGLAVPRQIEGIRGGVRRLEDQFVNRLLSTAAIAALAFVPLSVSAEGPTGVSGLILDANTKAPITGVRIVVARDEQPPQEK